MSISPVCKPIERVTVRNRVIVRLRDGKCPARFYTFHGLPDGREHVLLEFGRNLRQPVLVRVHSECLTGDVFGSQLCDCGAQLGEAIDRMAAEGGYLIYLRQEGRGIGLYAKLDSYELQRKGLDTFEANRRLHLPDDMRDYRAAALMLQALDCGAIRLFSNNPDKAAQLEGYGIRVVERVRTGTFVTPYNLHYLRAKAQKAHHMLDLISCSSY